MEFLKKILNSEGGILGLVFLGGVVLASFFPGAVIIIILAAIVWGIMQANRKPDGKA